MGNTVAKIRQIKNKMRGIGVGGDSVALNFRHKKAAIKRLCLDLLLCSDLLLCLDILLKILNGARGRT